MLDWQATRSTLFVDHPLPQGSYSVMTSPWPHKLECGRLPYPTFLDLWWMETVMRGLVNNEYITSLHCNTTWKYASWCLESNLRPSDPIRASVSSFKLIIYLINCSSHEFCRIWEFLANSSNTWTSDIFFRYSIFLLKNRSWNYNFQIW